VLDLYSHMRQIGEFGQFLPIMLSLFRPIAKYL
jgi:hypothetical protein